MISIWCYGSDGINGARGVASGNHDTSHEIHRTHPHRYGEKQDNRHTSDEATTKINSFQVVFFGIHVPKREIRDEYQDDQPIASK